MNYMKEFVKEMLESRGDQDHKKGLWIIFIAFFILLLFWIGIYLIDIRGIFGIQSYRGFWWHAFRNRSPVEIMQWGVMSAVAIYAGRVAGIHEIKGDKKGKVLWLLVAATFAMMVIEDAGDPRHIQGRYFRQFFNMPTIMVEAMFFGTMVTPIIYGFLRYWKKAFYFPATRPYFLLGGFLYAFAATTSLFRGVQGFYTRIGDRISNAFFGGEANGFLLIDFVFEESIELLAGSIFLGGLVIYHHKLGKKLSES